MISSIGYVGTHLLSRGVTSLSQLIHNPPLFLKFLRIKLTLVWSAGDLVPAPVTDVIAGSKTFLHLIQIQWD